MKFGSLFSGIGGMDLGLERAGMLCKWQVEIDDYCQRVLTKHWPKVEKFREVRNVGKENLQTIDLIAGGFPCQPYSVAGKRKGAADNRNLWPEFSRVIAELQPQYVIAENVLGIISSYIDTVLSDLEGQGYTIATFNLPAIAFDAPHRRERIFIVGYSEEFRRNEVPVTFSGENRKSKITPRGSSSNFPDPNERRLWNDEESDRGRELSTIIGNDGANKSLADTDRTRKSQPQRLEQAQRGWSINGGDGQITEHNSSNWTIEPNVGRVAHGIPNRVHRLRGLGNAVVPQVAEWIGRRIMEFDGT